MAYLHTTPSLFTDGERTNPLAAMRKRLFRFKVAGHKYRYSKLPDMSWSGLCRLANVAALEGKYEYAAWAFEAMLVQSRDLESSWRAAWKAVSPVDDDAMLWVLDALLRSAANLHGVATACADDVRCCLLIGKLYVSYAHKYQSTDSGQLERCRNIALGFLETARARIARHSTELIGERARLVGDVDATLAAARQLYWIQPPG